MKKLVACKKRFECSFLCSHRSPHEERKDCNNKCYNSTIEKPCTTFCEKIK